MQPEELDKELQTEILKDIGEISNLPVSLEKRLKWITEVTSRRLGVDSCSICLVDKDRELVVLKASTGYNQASIDHVELKMGEGVTGWCALHKEPVNLEDAFQDERFLYIPSTGEDKYVSLYAHPIIFQKECIGVLLINSKKRRKFKRDEINIVNTIAHFVSGIIQNTQLFEKQQKALQSRTILFNYSQEILGEKSQQRILDRMVAAVSSLTRAQYTGFWSKDSRNNLSLVSHGKEERPFFHKKILMRKLKSACPDFSFHLGFKLNTQMFPVALSYFIKGVEVKNAELIPLSVGRKVVGVMLIANDMVTEDSGVLDENDIQRVMTLMNITSVALRNIHLYNNLIDKNHELKEKEFALVESEKNSALGRLSLELAHEIKNPLLAIGGFAKRLDDKLKDTPTLKKYSEIIITEAARLELLVKTTLALIKEQDTVQKKVDLSKVVLERVEYYRQVYPKSTLHFVVELEKNLILQGDENKLMQVFNNLIDNSIEVCSRKAGCVIKIKAHRNTRSIIVTLLDNCGGVKPEFLSKLVKPYFSTKEYGTGLGLFIVKKVVSSHGGKVFLNNVDGGLQTTLLFDLSKK